MNKGFIILLFILSSCSHAGVASFSSNIITYGVTGKTNADHAVSMLMQKDCDIKRVLKEKDICK